jgi:hypothetical protein
VAVYVAGDLAAFACTTYTGQRLLLASFHGDTNGRGTIPIVEALQRAAAASYPDHVLVMGLDANTYKVHSADYQGVGDFQGFLESHNLESCWGPCPDALRPTTCNARTCLQPQLNKAIASNERLVKADKNLKDWILFRSGDASTIVTCCNSSRDNTGARAYVDDLIFPTTSFPSDHAVVSALLTISSQHENAAAPEPHEHEFRRRPSQH